MPATAHLPQGEGRMGERGIGDYPVKWGGG